MLKKLNELNEIKKVETNGKRLIESQKKLLSLFDDLKTIFNEKENESENVDENENENESESENESQSESESERDGESKKEKKYITMR